MPIVSSLVLPAYSPLPRFNLGVGDVVVVDHPAIIWTVLGTCVAVVLRVPRLALSAVCHAQLPEPDTRTGPSCLAGCPKQCPREPQVNRGLKYVTCCIRRMFDELHRRGALKIEIVASLYGGANVVPLIASEHSVGDRNVAIAQAMLEREGISIVTSDVGGTRGRSIEHDSGTNQTNVRYHESRF